MICFKTGARLHITNYNRVVPCDLFDVGDCIVALLPNEETLYSSPFFGDTEVTHEVYIDDLDSFWKKDRGILVVPADALTAVKQDETVAS